MRTKTLGTTAAVIGILLIAGALLLRFIIVPGMLQLPADVDVTRTYEGTMNRLLNPAALAEGDLANLFITDAPVELTRHIVVDATEGDDALVLEEAQAVLGDGTPVAEQSDAYAVDRRTMEHSDGYADDERVLDREGLVIGWPIGTEQQDYLGWSDDLQTTVTATYAGEETIEGTDTYVFTSEVAPSVITDPELLASLPEGLPKATLTQLALQAPGDLPLPLGEMAAIVAELPDPVPLTYLYSGSTTYWVEPASGVVVDIERSETREAALTTDSLPDPLPLTAVFDWTYEQSDASVADAITETTDAADQISLFGTTLPYVLLAVGVILLVLGLFMRRRDGRGSDGSPTVDGSSAVSSDQRRPVGTG